MLLSRPTPEQFQAVKRWYDQAEAQMPIEGVQMHMFVGPQEAFAGVSLPPGSAVTVLGLAGRTAGCRAVLRLCAELAVAANRVVLCVGALNEDALEAEGYTELGPGTWAKDPAAPDIEEEPEPEEEPVEPPEPEYEEMPEEPPASPPPPQRIGPKRSSKRRKGKRR